LGGAQPLAKAVSLSAKVRNLFTDAGFALNVAKSHFDPEAEQEFVGYLVNCSLQTDPELNGFSDSQKCVTKPVMFCGSGHPVVLDRLGLAVPMVGCCADQSCYLF
jgi:hypothetical protein